jgi:hypothetical protein
MKQKIGVGFLWFALVLETTGFQASGLQSKTRASENQCQRRPAQPKIRASENQCQRRPAKTNGPQTKRSDKESKRQPQKKEGA